MNNHTINVYVKTPDQIRKSRRFLRKNGIYWDSRLTCFSGVVNPRRFRRVSEFCKTNGLRYKIINDFSERSANYRYEFFKNNKPKIFNRYICVYCGRLMTVKQTTVDHFYPIGAASKSLSLQKRLKRRGLENINDVKNLVPACERCNKRKSAKMGWWLVAGRLGQITWLWWFRYAIRIGLVTFLLTLLIK